MAALKTQLLLPHQARPLADILLRFISSNRAGPHGSSVLPVTLLAVIEQVATRLLALCCVRIFCVAEARADVVAAGAAGGARGCGGGRRLCGCGGLGGGHGATVGRVGGFGVGDDDDDDDDDDAAAESKNQKGLRKRLGT